MECAEFLSKEELGFVATVREKFSSDLAAREALGKAFPCFFGSVALARIFQACENETEKACEWFQNLQKTLSEPETEALVEDVHKRFETHEVVSASMLPHHDSVKDFYNVQLCAPKLSPDGDIIVYLPLVDLDRNGILEHMDWDHWVTFSRASTILHCVLLDKLSRESQRMARIILVVDLEGLPLEAVVHRTFARAHRRDVVDSFQQRVAAEVVAQVYVVNVPWTLANLFTLCKTFLPAKFLQKCRVLSNALNDKDFVKHCGGQEQMTDLLASRKGLVSNTSAHDGQQLFLLDSWPDEEEMQMISRLKEKFAVEIEERSARGTAWPCFFGDLALARVLRGNERYFSEASNWFQAFLKKMEKHQVDELVKKMSGELEAAERASMSMLPHAAEVQKYFRCTFSAPRLTPKGDVIWFIPMGDFDRKGIAENVKWEHFVEFVRAMVVLRALEAHRLSEQQHRMAKCITVVDLLGSGVGTTGAPRVEEFDEPNQKNVNFMRQIVIDILGPVYVLNAPWVAVKAFNWFKSLVPERFSRKLVLLDGDGLGDEDFVDLVGEAQLKQLLASRVGLLDGEADEDAGECVVAAGDSLKKCRDLMRGDTISWSSTVLQGDGDSWFGVSDIITSANIMFHPDLNSQHSDDEVTLEEMTVSASDGKVTRKYTAERDCVITLCWGNEHSRMRGKGLQFDIHIRPSGSSATPNSPVQQQTL